MIELFTYATPNGRKVSIMLEELGLPYRVRVVDFAQQDQKSPWYAEVSPNGKIPAIRDPEGPDGQPITLFESGAILMYLAEKTGSPLLPPRPAARAVTVQWLMFQMAGVGPMFGQAGYFRNLAPEPVPAAIDRYTGEANRLADVMEGRLADAPYLAGETYTIADIATYPWVALHGRLGVSLDSRPRLAGWMERIGARPAVQAGMAVPG